MECFSVSPGEMKASGTQELLDKLPLMEEVGIVTFVLVFELPNLRIVPVVDERRNERRNNRADNSNQRKNSRNRQ